MNLFNTSTDSILAVFKKTVDKLEKHAANSHSTGVALRERGNDLIEQGNAHITEVFKARAAAEKIKGLYE